MARPREPIALIVAKGKKNLTKDEISERLATEPQPATDEIEAPDYLTAAQKKHFDKLAGQLEKICIMGETDCDTLARYVVAESMYEQAVKDTRAAHKQRPKSPTPDMLIANGFTRENNKYNLTIQASRTLLRIENMDLCFEGMARLFALNVCGSIHNFRVRYVHELQHILRLMDLSELADNFKLE